MIPAAIQQLNDGLCACTLCPQRCGVDRSAGERGRSRVGSLAPVCSSGAHFGEERVLVGQGGSGTIFFSGCNLRCLFCQNHDISQRVVGPLLDAEALAALMMRLEAGGCENINLVSPTHVAAVVAHAIHLAREAGLRRPVVFNCGGYEAVETIRALEGLVDIYMPDFKWGGAEDGERLSGAADYPAHAEAALGEMFRQVGALRRGSRGVATRGVLVRHLVMPGRVDSGRAVLEAVARAAPGAAVNVMGQYRPAYRARSHASLTQRLGWQEVRSLRSMAAHLGLERVDEGALP